MKKAVLSVLLLSLFFALPQSSHAQSGDSTCYATGDFNQDDIVNHHPTRIDLVEVMQSFRDSNTMKPWYEVDLTGDCIVDSSDINLLFCMLKGSNTCLPIMPVPTCCNPVVKWETGDSMFFATGDLNGDGEYRTVSDLAELMKVIHDSSSQFPLYVFDLTGDCNVDSSDVKMFWHDINTLPIVPYFPVRTCANPTVNGHAGDSICYATLDINQDSVAMTVADLIAFVRLLTDSTAQIPWFEADLTGDCIVDTADMRKFLEFFTYGFSVFPQYPVPTCCNPDISWVCCLFKRGNVNGGPDDAVNVVDVTHLVNYLFKGGPPPFCLDEGNVNGDPKGSINVIDITFLVNHLFKGGPEPPNCLDGMPF